MRKIISLLLICFLTSGCIPLLVGSAVYGVQKGKANKTERLKAYDDYVLSIEKLNIEREEKGLDPLEVKTFEDWNSPKANE